MQRLQYLIKSHHFVIYLIIIKSHSCGNVHVHGHCNIEETEPIIIITQPQECELFTDIEVKTIIEARCKINYCVPIQRYLSNISIQEWVQCELLH